MTKHARCHTGERPYSCAAEGCAYRARSQSNLRLHALSAHSDARPHPCSAPGCAYAAKNLSSLRRHERAVHRLGVGPRCPHEGCDYLGATPRSFEEHVNAHLGIQPHRCTKCHAYASTYKSHYTRATTLHTF
jgi:hypothetical protein